MKQSLLSLLCLGLAVLAKDESPNKVVEVFLPGFGGLDLAGSVVHAESSMTTYSLTCGAAMSEGPCPIQNGYTLVQGPSTVQVSMHSGKMHNSVTCSIDSTVSADCVGVMTGTDDSGSVVSVSTPVVFTGTDMERATVTLIAGAEKSTDSASAGATGTAPTGGVTPTASGPVETGATTSGSSADASGTPSTSSSDGAGPVVTAGSWVLGVAGAAALAAL